MKFDTNKDKGRTGLAIAIGYYGSIGYTVCLPLNDTQDYDFIIDTGNALEKVQVKSTSCLNNYGSYEVSLRNCGGTNGSVYGRVKDSDINRLFVLCSNGWTFDIPSDVITQSSTLYLRDFPSPFSNSEDFSKYLVTFDVLSPIPTIKKREPKKNHCIDCGIEISTKGAIRCKACNNKHLSSKTSWTSENRGERASREELEDLIRKGIPYTTIGKQYNVSDNTIRKWCKKYSLPRTQQEIKEWLIMGK